MHRSLVLVLAIACALGVVALVIAQDASSPGDAGTDPCATPGAGTPEGTPARPDMGTPDATPGASPEACPPPGAATVRVELVDIAFNPKEITIPANTDVTIELPNVGAAGHNFSITDKNNPNLPNLGIDVDVAPGQSTTVTVDAPPGDYYFFCNVPGHEPAGMFGTMHVQ